MIEQMYEEKTIIFLMTGFCILCVIIKAAISFRYRYLIREADDMSNSGCKLMGIIRQKFESEYERAYSVNNVSVFVDKYIYEMKFVGLRSSTWEGLGLSAIVLCLLLGSVGALWSYEYGKISADIIMYIMAGVTSAGVLVLTDSIINVQRRKEHLHINICNHLENHMKPRIERGEYDYGIKNLTKLSDEVDEGLMALINSISSVGSEQSKKVETKNKVNDNSLNLSKCEQKIVEDVIKEYLT